MGKATIRDVSRVTGLSTYTVSRALSGAPGVSTDSREQVLAAARQIGYIPNRAAQGLRRGSRDSIAVIVASTANSYYLDLMAGIQQALRHSDWTVIIADVAGHGITASLATGVIKSAFSIYSGICPERPAELITKMNLHMYTVM